MKYEALDLSIERQIAAIVMIRPDSGNLVDRRFLRELSDACDQIADGRDARVVVLSSAGFVFSKGWASDLADAAPSDVDFDPFGCLARLPQPVVAAVGGEATSAGCELALACDVRLASRSASFSLPETQSGALPRAGGSQRLPRLVGRGRALSMLLTGEALTGEAAYSAGLVSEVTADADLSHRALAIAERIASRGPIALRYAKEAVHRGLDMTLDQAMRYETDLTIILQTTEDRAEGVRAFHEGKRVPEFKDR